MRRTVASAVFAIFVGALLPLASAQALEPTGRCLGSHCFQMPTLFPNAFITTQFGFTQGVQSLSSKDVDVFGDGTTMDLSMMGIREELDYMMAFSRGFGVFVKGTGTVLTGTNSDSALIAGGQGSFGGSIGAALALLRTDGTLVTLRAAVAKGKNLQVTPIIALLSVANGASITDSAGSMFSSSNAVGFLPSLMLAQSLGKALGLQAGVWLEYMKADDADATKGLNGAAALEFDLGAVSQMPLALAGEFSYSRTLGLDEDVKSFGGGLYYSGRSDLQLGLFLATMIQAKSDDYPNGVDNVYGQLTMRYFF
jgi:hypothetical protein